MGPGRPIRPARRRQPGDTVQAQPLEPGTEHHHHQRLLAAVAVRGIVQAAVPQVRGLARAAAPPRPGHRVLGLPRFRHHHDHVHQTGERARRVARTVRHRLAHVLADRQRHIHQPDHFASVRQRERGKFTRPVAYARKMGREGGDQSKRRIGPLPRQKTNSLTHPPSTPPDNFPAPVFTMFSQ